MCVWLHSHVTEGIGDNVRSFSIHDSFLVFKHHNTGNKVPTENACSTDNHDRVCKAAVPDVTRLTTAQV